MPPLPVSSGIISQRGAFTYIWCPGLFTSDTPVFVAATRGPTELMDLEAKVACVPGYGGKLLER